MDRRELIGVLGGQRRLRGQFSREISCPVWQVALVYQDRQGCCVPLKRANPFVFRVGKLPDSHYSRSIDRSQLP